MVDDRAPPVLQPSELVEALEESIGLCIAPEEQDKAAPVALRILAMELEVDADRPLVRTRAEKSHTPHCLPRDARGPASRLAAARLAPPGRAVTRPAERERCPAELERGGQQWQLAVGTKEMQLRGSGRISRRRR